MSGINCVVNVIDYGAQALRWVRASNVGDGDSQDMTEDGKMEE
jgi:hypothetical protein